MLFLFIIAGHKTIHNSYFSGYKKLDESIISQSIPDTTQ